MENGNDAAMFCARVKERAQTGIEIVEATMIRYDPIHEIVYVEEVWVIGKMTKIDSAYTKNECAYIGNWRDADALADLGITPQPRRPHHRVASIGKSAKDGKWYGWSRLSGMVGFSVGDKVDDGHVTADSLPVGFVAGTDAEARQMAEAYAAGVNKMLGTGGNF